jgi:hypothetical protein
MRAATELPDGELLELHREVSRLATFARQRDPKFRARHELGVKASAARSRHGADIASPKDRGQ